MASGGTARTSDECVVCLNPLKNPRVLKCKHVFCLACLENIEYRGSVRCPQCRADTAIPVGLHVRHLPKRVQGVTRTGERRRLKLVTSWDIPVCINDMAVDEESQVLYVASYGNDESVLQYSYTGELVATMKLDFLCCRLAFDSKRGLLIVSGADKASKKTSELHLYNAEGTLSGKIKNSQFRDIGRVSYHVNLDKYLVVDAGARCVFMVDPDTCEAKPIKMTSCKVAKDKDGSLKQNALICASPAARVQAWAVADLDQNAVSLYDRDGDLVKAYGGQGCGHGRFDDIYGLCMDGQGRVLVSDFKNSQVVRLTPDALDKEEWSVLTNTADHLLGGPGYIQVTRDGLLFLAAYPLSSNDDIPPKLSVLSGYDEE